MNETPLISVVLNVYNGEAFVAESIQSVLAQTYTNLEMIVVDDASDDRTLEIIQSFSDPRLHVLTRKMRRHISYTINEGLAIAKGDWIAHIDADDIWESDKLEKQMSYLMEHPEIGACFSFINLIDQDNQIINDRYPDILKLYNTSYDTQKEWVRQFFYKKNCICYPSSVIRRDLAYPQNLFIRMLHDFNLWCQIIPKTNFYVYPEPLVRQRWVIHDNKSSSLASVTNEIRIENETTLFINRQLLDGLSNEQFIEFFREDFRNPDSSTPTELKIEKAFLLMNSDFFPGDANPAVFQAFEEALQDEGALELLEEKYDYSIFDIYALTGNEVFRSNRLNIEFTRTSNDLVTANHMLEDLYASRSWRITAPMRSFSEWMAKVADTTPIRLLRKTVKDLKMQGLRATLAHIAYYLHSARQERSWHRSNQGYTTEEYEAKKAETFSRDVKFSILVPLYNTPEQFLREMIDSVQKQTYPNWELCLADGSDDAHPEVGRICAELVANDSRIVYRKLTENLGISGNTNACIDMSSGNYIALFDHDDLLHPFVLTEVMHAICEQDADFIYTDECVFESPDIRKITTVHCKPDYSPDALRANNYICHFSVFSREILDKAGHFRSAFDGSQDHDLILRLTSCARKIVHIPKILYHWRSHPASVASDISAKTYCITAGQNAVHESIAAHGIPGTVRSTAAFPTIYQISYRLSNPGKVSIIVPCFNDREALERCITSIIKKSTWENYEIIIADNASTDPALLDYYNSLPNRVKLCRIDTSSKPAALYNKAAELAVGSYLVLLDEKAEVISPDWMESLMMYAQRPDVGAVGSITFYPSGAMHNAGLALGLGEDQIAGPLFQFCPRNAIGYMGRACYAQDLSAVSGVCMMVRTDLWNEIGGYDAAYAANYLDVDFCLKLRRKGLLNVWTPFAEMYTYQPQRQKHTRSEREIRQQDANEFRAHWGEVLAAGDPYYNPNFATDSSDFRIRSEALAKVFPAR